MVPLGSMSKTEKTTCVTGFRVQGVRQGYTNPKPQTPNPQHLQGSLGPQALEQLHRRSVLRLFVFFARRANAGTYWAHYSLFPLART